MPSSHHISLQLAADRARDLREEARRSPGRRREQARTAPSAGLAARFVLRVSRRSAPAPRDLRAPASRG